LNDSATSAAESPDDDVFYLFFSGRKGGDREPAAEGDVIIIKNTSCPHTADTAEQNCTEKTGGGAGNLVAGTYVDEEVDNEEHNIHACN